MMICEYMRKVLPHACMIFVQLCIAGFIVLSKVVLTQGISSSVLSLYQFIVATIFMALLAILFERNNRPPLTKSILWRIFLVAFVGQTFALNLLQASLYFISSRVEAAVQNMIPLFTFVLSVLSRQEKLGIKTLWGQGKLFGVLLSLSGAFTLVLWRGSPLHLLLTTTTSLHFLLGLLMLLLGTLANSFYILLLGPMAAKYTAQISLSAIMLFFAAVQGAVVAAIQSPKPEKWQLKWDLELLNLILGGVFFSGVANLLTLKVVSIKGPIFAASFAPLGLIIATVLELIFLGQSLTTGSVVGMALIIVGLYIFLWSKAKEEARSLAVVDEEPLAASLLPRHS